MFFRSKLFRVIHLSLAPLRLSYFLVFDLAALDASSLHLLILLAASSTEEPELLEEVAGIGKSAAEEATQIAATEERE